MFHVLLVEDNPSDVLLIREAIRTSDVPTDVTIAYDGAQALRILEDANPAPDLIILEPSEGWRIGNSAPPSPERRTSAGRGVHFISRGAYACNGFGRVGLHHKADDVG